MHKVLNHKYSLLSELLRMSALSRKRNPAYGKEPLLRFIVWLFYAMSLLALAWVGLLLAFMVENNHSAGGIEFVCGILPFILLADFLLRLVKSNTPLQLVKPYSLLPLPKYAIADAFLVESLFRPVNFVWQVFFIPYGVVAIVPSEGVAAFLVFIVVMQIVIAISSLWYTLVRSLFLKKLLWAVLPIIVYGAATIPAFTGQNSFLDNFCGFYSNIGMWFVAHFPVLLLTIISLFAGTFIIDRNLLQWVFNSETDTSQSSSAKHRGTLSFAEVRNDTVIYLRLELASVVRNHNRRRNFIEAALFAVLTSLLVAFASTRGDNYQQGTQLYMLLCSFILFPLIQAGKIMGYEGNYIECLMMTRGGLLSLLRAKYYFSCATVVIPFLILLPTTIAGMLNIWELVSMALFAAGPVNFTYFQLAVTNNQTISLQSRSTGKDNKRPSNKVLVLTLLLTIIPIIIISPFEILFGMSVASFIVSAVSLPFIFTYRLWLRNIYNRMMVRKYENLESFSATR